MTHGEKGEAPHEAPHEVPHEEEDLSISGYGSTFVLKLGKTFSPEEIKVLAAALIKSIEDALMRRGAKGIGHIKLHMKGRSGYLRADTIGSKYGIHVEGTISEPEESLQMTINTIAIRASKEDVFRATGEGLEGVAKGYSFVVVELKSDRI